MNAPQLVHASCVAIDEKGVLIIGPSGAGKSDLALRLIDRGAQLVGDDYVLVVRENDVLRAAPPEQLVGKLEVRGVGLCRFDHVSNIGLTLIVDLAQPPVRLPDPQETELLGIKLPLLHLLPHEASAPIKVELAMKQGVGVI
ncbi:MAG: hypothetical protein RIQ68_1702 [Pseudomonadota bacterium]|jgi:serine kinase of HPr protein (carbohydrate metabolism regulator)